MKMGRSWGAFYIYVQFPESGLSDRQWICLEIADWLVDVIQASIDKD